MCIDRLLIMQPLLFCARSGTYRMLSATPSQTPRFIDVHLSLYTIYQCFVFICVTFVNPEHYLIVTVVAFPIDTETLCNFFLISSLILVSVLIDLSWSVVFCFNKFREMVMVRLMINGLLYVW